MVPGFNSILMYNYYRSVDFNLQGKGRGRAAIRPLTFLSLNHLPCGIQLNFFISAQDKMIETSVVGYNI